MFSFKFGSGMDRNNKNAINDFQIANSPFTYLLNILGLIIWSEGFMVE